jgi:tRNA-guanine family transglycosylase
MIEFKILKKSKKSQARLGILKTEIRFGQQPKLLKITDRGVFFHSFLDGKKLFFGPKESIEIQEKLGADIIFAFEEGEDLKI